MAVNTDALANQAAAQGQQMLNQDNTNAAQYKSSYDQYQQQADAANKNVSDYTNYMAGAGSAGNQYNNELIKQEGDLGYDPAQMTAARNNLNQATGALSAYSDFANTAASKWGQNAGGFAAANSGALSGLNNNIASNQNVANGLQSLYTTAQTGANQFAGQQVAGEQNTLQGYQQAYSNAASSRDAAGQQMQFWGNLASQQGGLNSQQQQAYAAAQASYAAASQSMAQAALYQQQYQHQQTLWNAPTPPTNATGSPTPNKTSNVSTPVHNQYFNVNSTNLPSFVHSVGGDLVNGATSIGNFLTGNHVALTQNDKTLSGWGG